eukprot:g1990.t1
MIHSKEKHGKDIFSFMQRWRAEFPDVPVIAVPTTYDHVTEEELQEAGMNVCIYANQLLRASYMAMLETAKKILEAGLAENPASRAADSADEADDFAHRRQHAEEVLYEVDGTGKPNEVFDLIQEDLDKL